MGKHKHAFAIGQGHQIQTPNLPPIRPFQPPFIPPGLEPTAQFFTMGKATIIVGRGPDGWHMSIAMPDQYPGWDWIAKARYELLPADINCAIMLPPAADYVAFHDFCFQVWEIPLEYAR